MTYLVVATKVVHIEALVEGESFDDAAQRFLLGEYVHEAIVAEDEPQIHEVVVAP